MNSVPNPKYDSDEILILAGKFADQHNATFFSQVLSKNGDKLRNAVADAVENVMRDYTGVADVPLPKDLLADMTRVADTVATAQLTAALNPIGGTGF